MNGRKIDESASASNTADVKSDSKKYNFYRKPSIKKKIPEVKQTLTSYKRMLKANPLLKYEMEGKDLSSLTKQLQNSGHSSVSSQRKNEIIPAKNIPKEKQSLQPNFNTGKPLVTKIQRSQSLKRPPNCLAQPIKKGTTSIISGSKRCLGKNVDSSNISRQSSVDFNTPTSKLFSSTRLENLSKNQSINKNGANHNKTVKPEKQAKSLTQDNSVSSTEILNNRSRKDKLNRNKPLRRSLSAQHFDRKKGGTIDQKSRVELAQSLEDVTKVKPLVTMQHDISPIAEGSRESSMIFKTPSAYERRSILKSTPNVLLSARRSLYHTTTPLPSLYDLQKRLNDWLLKRGKSISSFHHLKCFGIQENESNIIDEENKENIEVDQDLDKGSYEDLKIIVADCNGIPQCNSRQSLSTEENSEGIAKAALEDLLKLIQDGYPGLQCEGWLELIRQKYKKLEEEPQYWECRAAIEQSRGNIANAVQCYKTAIVQGAEIQAVDESLDTLLQKFSLLNISTKDVENERSNRERARIVRDARNVFKSSIIQFAVQERKLKKDGKTQEKKFVATPVRRSTRLSRSAAYTSTPGVKIFSSLHELETSDRALLDFKKNKALF